MKGGKRSAARRWAVIAPGTSVKTVLLLASSLTVMAAAIIAPSLPGIDAHFGDHPDVLIKLVLTLPALFIALSGVLVGIMADRFGRKRLLLGSLLLYGCAGVSGYLAESLVWLLLGRAALGIAVAGIISMCTTLIGDYFPPGDRARFLGFQGSFMVLGGLLFLNAGGWLAEWSWRGPFLVYLLSFLLIPVALRVLYEPASPATAEPGFSHGGQVDRVRTALVYGLSTVGMMFLYVVPTQLPFFLGEEAEVGSAAIGFAISTTTVTSAFVSFFYGRIRRVLSFSGIYSIAFLLIGGGYAVTGYSDSYAMATLGIALSGFGLGLFMPNGAAWLMTITPDKARGRVFGGYTSMLYLGQFLSPLAVAPLALRAPSLAHVFVAVAVLAAGLAALLAIPSLAAARQLFERRKPRAGPEDFRA